MFRFYRTTMIIIMKKLLFVGLGIVFISVISFNLSIAMGKNSVASPDEGWHYFWHTHKCPKDETKTYEQCDSSGAYIQCSTWGALRNNHCSPPE